LPNVKRPRRSGTERLRRDRRRVLPAGGSFSYAQLLYERAQGANLDFRQGGPRSLVADQIARFLEQVDEFLARGELDPVSQFPLLFRLVRRLPCARRSRARIVAAHRAFVVTVSTGLAAKWPPSSI
jgi:hypothetical protein